MPELLKSPTTGKTLILVATKTLTETSNTTPKKVAITREYIEVIVGENIGVVPASIFGHTAIDIEGTVYSRAHDKYAEIQKDKYINGGEALAGGRISAGQRATRNSVGIVLWLSPREKQLVLTELKRRVTVDKKFREEHPSESSYSLINNSCSSNVADVLELVGILAHDPRFFSTPVSPKELLISLERSNRMVGRINYPKVAK